jgi:hypothetical protein
MFPLDWFRNQFQPASLIRKGQRMTFKNTHTLFGLSALLLLVVLAQTTTAQQDTISSATSDSEPAAFASLLHLGPPPAQPVSGSVITSFIGVEAQVRAALNQHTFKRDVVLQTIGPNGEVTGGYVRNSQFVFDDKGNRIERVLFHPRSTLQGIKISKEDIQDLAGSQLLGVDVTEASKYLLTLAGSELIEGRSLYAVNVSPRYAPDPYRMRERFFVGRLWLDVETLQVVKIRGTVHPQGKQRFPLFETSRQWVAGSMLFPSSTIADDVLHFRDRDVHCRIKVRYHDYKRFQSTVKISEVNDQLPK